MEKLDILVIAAHPDDAELSCSGTLMKHADAGKKVGVLDLTQGEMGTRGTIETRAQEAQDAAEILGLTVRDNMKFRDGFFQNDEDHQLALIERIRYYAPEIVITNAPKDRHPDHGRAAELVLRACFLAGLRKIETKYDGSIQNPHRPAKVFHFIQDTFLVPDFVVDITNQWERKKQSIFAYKTQFHTPEASALDEPQTYISTPDFMKFIEARSLEFGHSIGATYGEGFLKTSQLSIPDLFTIL